MSIFVCNPLQDMSQSQREVFFRFNVVPIQVGGMVAHCVAVADTKHAARSYCSATHRKKLDHIFHSMQSISARSGKCELHRGRRGGCVLTGLDAIDLVVVGTPCQPWCQRRNRFDVKPDQHPLYPTSMTHLLQLLDTYDVGGVILENIAEMQEPVVEVHDDVVVSLSDLQILVGELKERGFSVDYWILDNGTWIDVPRRRLPMLLLY